jgi:hypothetical protein
MAVIDDDPEQEEGEAEGVVGYGTDPNAYDMATNFPIKPQRSQKKERPESAGGDVEGSALPEGAIAVKVDGRLIANSADMCGAHGRIFYSMMGLVPTPLLRRLKLLHACDPMPCLSDVHSLSPVDAVNPVQTL